MKNKEIFKQSKTTNAIKITNEYNQSNTPSNPLTIKNDFSRIKDQILTEIRHDLFNQNNESIMTNYKSVIKMLETDIITKCNTKGINIKAIQNLITKKLESLLSYIYERERANEENKTQALDTLSHYLNQLSDIIFNYFLLNHNDNSNINSNDNCDPNGNEAEYYNNNYNRDHDSYPDQCSHSHSKGGEVLNEKFVSLINMLSKLIKSYTSKAQLISKLSNDLLRKMNEKLLFCKTLSSDIYIQSSIINKANIKAIQSKGGYLNETLESLLSFQSEITNKSLSIESNHSSFYSEAKDIFRKLKTLQSELKAKAHTSASPSYDDNDTHHLRAETPTYKVKQIDHLLSQQKQKQSMSRSTEHFNNSQKIYLNNINNSFNEAYVVNTSPADTEPQDIIFNFNNTMGSQQQSKLNRGLFQLNKSNNLNELIERNKILQTEVDNLNSTMTKSNFERRRLKTELADIKKNVQRKHNLSTSIDTANRPCDSNNYKGTKSIISKQDNLAKRVIEFIQDMKDLQDSICKKDKDVIHKKKEFERKKKELIYLANDYKDKISFSSYEKEDTSTKTDKGQIQTQGQGLGQGYELGKDKEKDKDMEVVIENKTKEIIELKEQNEKLINELEMKKAEIIKIQETIINTKKLNETKKNVSSIPMAKLKELENIIKTLKSQIETLKEEMKEKEKTIEDLKQNNTRLKNEPTEINEKRTNELNHYTAKCSFLNEHLITLINKVNNIYNILTIDKQPIELFIASKDIEEEDITKVDIVYTEITKLLSSLTKEQKAKQHQQQQQQQSSTPSTNTPSKTNNQLSSSLPSQSLIEENKRLKALFEECMAAVYASIKENIPELLEATEEDELSFNYGSGLNTPVNLLDSNNSNINQSAHATIDKENIQGAVEIFKQYNTQIKNELSKLKEEIQRIGKENELLQMRCDSYKKALDDVMKNNPNPNEKEFLINFNKTTKTFSLQDITEIPSENEQSISQLNYNKEGDMKLIKENERLNTQLKVLTEELRLKTEALSELNKNTKGKNNDKGKSSNNQDNNEYRELYLKAEERIKELEEQYENLVKEVINEEQEDADNNKVDISQGKGNTHTMHSNMNLMQMINSHHYSNDNPHLNKNFNSKILESINETNNQVEDHEELLLTQLSAIKLELKQQREENEILKRKACELKEYDKNDFAAPIKSALEKLILEITVTPKIKELLCVIFKIIGCTEEEIAKLFIDKDKKKHHKKLFS